MNMVTHIIGGIFGIIALVLCVVFSSIKKDAGLIVGSCIYGVSLIVLYTNSSIYHGLKPSMGKKVMQVIDHCTIFLLIGGTYTPILLGSICKLSPVWGWTIFGIVWGACIIGTIFTAIDLKKYAVLSMICYICIGWVVVIAGRTVIDALTFKGFLWVLYGGIAYTVGAVFYGIGAKKRYIHSVFHIFVLLGTGLQFVGIFKYVIL